MTEQQIRNDPNYVPWREENDCLMVTENGDWLIWSTETRMAGLNLKYDWMRMGKNYVFRTPR